MGETDQTIIQKFLEGIDLPFKFPRHYTYFPSTDSRIEVLAPVKQSNRLVIAKRLLISDIFIAIPSKYSATSEEKYITSYHPFLPLVMHIPLFSRNF
jgi:hypothetical protein